MPPVVTYQRVDEVLFDMWDPIGVNAFAPRDEYTSYVAEIIALAESGANQDAIAERLGEIARNRMGLSHVDSVRDARVAHQLIQIVRSAE